jgi:putative flippase GtrA
VRLPDRLVDSIGLDEYGPGLPFSMAVVGLAFMLWAGSGATSFGALTDYGKFGVLVAFLAGMVLIAAAGYTYREVDIRQYMETRP